MRCLIIHNPTAGPQSDEIFAFAYALMAEGDEVVFRFIGKNLAAAHACHDAQDFDRVVASGGDGTVSAVLDCLRNTKVPVLVFPAGTSNLFFNNIGNAPEAIALAAACRAGKTAQVDMGELTWMGLEGKRQRRGFIIIAGTGFDAEIMLKSADIHGDMGEIAYFLSALATPLPQVAHFRIEHDGEVDELDGIGCMVGNTAMIQNEINLFPKCRMDDGLIDIAVIESERLIGLLPTVIAGVLDPHGKGLGRPSFKLFQAREAHIRVTPSLGMEFDGELIEEKPTEFSARVLPKCLDIIVDDFSHLSEHSAR